MTAVSPTRWILGAVGFVAGLYGLYLLLTNQQGDQLVSVGIWLLGSVVVHDALIALIAIGIGFVVTRFVPEVVRPPLVVGLVVLGTISIVAVPMVGAFGRIPDNPTLLDRNYVAGFALIVGLIVVGVVVGVVLRVRASGGSTSRRDAGEDDEPDARGGPPASDGA